MTLRHILLAVAALAGCTMASAGMDIDEYMPPSELIELSEEEARRQRERVRRETEQARIEVERQERLKRADRERVKAEQAARPRGLRLLEQRCSGCHDIELVTLRPRTTLGWAWVTLRMQWINGAELGAGERTLIATYLADHHRAPTRRALFELAVATVVVALVAALSWRGIRARRSRKTSTSKDA